MAEWKKVIVSGSNAELATLNATAVTASLEGNVVGNLTGTASWATTASWALNSPASISSSYAISASFAQVAALANEATALQTARDFSVTGSGITAAAVSFDGTGAVVLNASIDADAVTTAKIANDAVTNAKLENDTVTVGSTNIALGASATTLAGLTSVTSTDFIGDLTGNADTATTANTASYVAATSAAQGQVTVGNGPAVDLGLETTDSVTFANQSIAGSGSYGGSLVVQGDLTVNGTASFINTQELLVEDKFVTFASGSTVATDGGFIVSQAPGNVGQAFAFESTDGRWGVASGVAYNTTSISPEAYVSLVVTASSAAYTKNGNMLIDGSGDIFIYA